MNRRSFLGRMVAAAAALGAVGSVTKVAEAAPEAPEMLKIIGGESWSPGVGRAYGSAVGVYTRAASDGTVAPQKPCIHGIGTAVRYPDGGARVSGWHIDPHDLPVTSGWTFTELEAVANGTWNGPPIRWCTEHDARVDAWRRSLHEHDDPSPELPHVPGACALCDLDR